MKIAVAIPVVMTARQQEPLQRQEYNCQALGIHGSSVMDVDHMIV